MNYLFWDLTNNFHAAKVYGTLQLNSRAVTCVIQRAAYTNYEYG